MPARAISHTQKLPSKPMIINSYLTRLLTPPLPMGEDWERRQVRWLSIVLDRLFQPVFEAQFEMVEGVIGIEKEIFQVEVERKWSISASASSR